MPPVGRRGTAKGKVGAQERLIWWPGSLRQVKPLFSGYVKQPSGSVGCGSLAQSPQTGEGSSNRGDYGGWPLCVEWAYSYASWSWRAAKEISTCSAEISGEVGPAQGKTVQRPGMD